MLHCFLNLLRLLKKYIFVADRGLTLSLKTVPLAYTLFLNTIYPSHSTQEAEGTVFRKHTVPLQYAA